MTKQAAANDSVMAPRESRSSGPWPGRVSRRRAWKRTARIARSASSEGVESLSVDARALLRPAQVVENKLTRLLQEASVPVSHLQMRGLLKTR
jgi:hypothetical protein